MYAIIVSRIMNGDFEIKRVAVEELIFIKYKIFEQT